MKKSIFTLLFICQIYFCIGQVVIDQSLSGKQKWNWGAPQSITLKNGFSYISEADNYFHGYIANEPLVSTLIYPSSSEIKLFEKVEFGVKLPSYIESYIQQYRSEPFFENGINPYDPGKIDLFAWFISPSGKSIRVNGFFFRILKEILFVNAIYLTVVISFSHAGKK